MVVLGEQNGYVPSTGASGGDTFVETTSSVSLRDRYSATCFQSERGVADAATSPGLQHGMRHDRANVLSATGH
jgi:hypothetical protein